MSIEDDALRALGEEALTYDQLRARLGVNPSELDAVLARLHRSRLVDRHGARFHVCGGSPAAPARVAEASAGEKPTMKRCPQCEQQKEPQEFYAEPKSRDGLSSWCRTCTRTKQKQYYEKGKQRAAGAAKKPRPKPAVTRAKAAPKRATTARPAISFGYSPPAAAAAIPQTPAIAILHFHDGVRIGPMVASASGISQMPFHVDLSAAQLDELCSWWAATREGGAAP